MLLPIASIRMDGGTQPRSVLSIEATTEYATAMKAGVRFPPVVTYYDGENYWLADGFHRVNAAIEAALEEIDADIVQGVLEDAKWHSFGANQHHGIRRTNDDKQRSVQAALGHIKSQGLSDSAIAKHVGVDSQTVSNWRHKMELSSEIRKIETRTVIRAGATYQQNVTNIGKRPAALPERQADPMPERITPNDLDLPPISREKVWACQLGKNFKKELLRLVRAYEKSNPPIEVLVIAHRNGMAVGVEVVATGDTAIEAEAS